MGYIQELAKEHTSEFEVMHIVVVPAGAVHTVVLLEAAHTVVLGAGHTVLPEELSELVVSVLPSRNIYIRLH